jgi:TonB family protein
MPEAIYSPEPSFSDEARKAKFQGIVMLMVVVGTDGRPYNIRVRQSLGMGLDEQAIAAVKNWRFRPATDVPWSTRRDADRRAGRLSLVLAKAVVDFSSQARSQRRV